MRVSLDNKRWEGGRGEKLRGIFAGNVPPLGEAAAAMERNVCWVGCLVSVGRGSSGHGRGRCWVVLFICDSPTLVYLILWQLSLQSSQVSSRMHMLYTMGRLTCKAIQLR